MNIIFSKGRRPLRTTLEECNHRKTHVLTRENQIVLPDVRLKVSWEKKNPRLYEN
ncbi:MAG: hypothetical protein K8R77_06480 [Anaerolineaceae bacterium]|nr:hypothetical protein [Anaerolineaceae bacterium]